MFSCLKKYTLFCLGLVCILYSTQLVQARPKSPQELAEIKKYLIKTDIQPGQIPSLYRPRYDEIKDAKLSKEKDEIVFLVQFPSGVRIYPQAIMAWHQIVNELIDDEAYAITYCPMTGTLLAYHASVQGMNLIFDIEGHLYEGNSVMVDRNTGSHWLQENGMSFSGALWGKGMATLPVFWTTWEAALRTYPNAPVLATPPGRRPYGRDPYGNYYKKGNYYDNDVVIYPLRHPDRRFPKKTPMLCLEFREALVAIDIAYVKRKKAVNFFAGPYALLAVHDQILDVVRIFDRRIWSEPFLFVQQNGKLKDLGSQSTWDAVTGNALSGNMKGASMKQYYGSYSMWMAWYSLNPETLVIPGPGEVQSDMLSTKKLFSPR